MGSVDLSNSLMDDPVIQSWSAQRPRTTRGFVGQRSVGRKLPIDKCHEKTGWMPKNGSFLEYSYTVSGQQGVREAEGRVIARGNWCFGGWKLRIVVLIEVCWVEKEVKG